MQTREIVVYEKIFEQIYKEKFNINLSFETDKFSEIIQNTNIVVGSFSTAFLESLYQKKPYYIYEPERNGLTETELYSNEICSKKFISRDYRDLKKNYSQKFFFCRKKFFNGNNIDRLDTFLKNCNVKKLTNLFYIKCCLRIYCNIHIANFYKVFES